MCATKALGGGRVARLSGIASADHGFGHSSSCSASGPDVYGRLAVAWTAAGSGGSLSHWLDPDNSGTRVVDGRDAGGSTGGTGGTGGTAGNSGGSGGGGAAPLLALLPLVLVRRRRRHIA